MTEQKKNIIVSIALIVMSVIGYIYCIGMVNPNEGSVGSAYAPKLVFACLFILSVLKLLMSGKVSRKPVTIATDPTIMKVGVGTVALVGMYAFFFRQIGFPIITFIYLTLQIKLLAPKGKVKWVMATIISAIATIIVYFLFVSAFHLLLPTGILGKFI